MESDVVTLQDVLSRKASGGGLARSRTDAGAPVPAVCTGLKPTSSRRWPLRGVALPPTFFERGGLRPGTPRLRRQVRPMSWKRKRIRIRVGIALGVAALTAVPTAGAGVKVSGVDATSFPRIRMTVVTSQPRKARR